MAKYKPRTTPPKRSDKWWNKPFNRCIPISGTFVLPNCVGYAWGRFAEIMGGDPGALPTTDAHLWYDADHVHKKGSKPKLGAAVVFRYQHVAIVEKVYPDGTFDVSESNYGGKLFVYRHERNLGSVRGFIYNPAVGDGDEVDESGGGDGGGTRGPLYQSKSTRADAVLREVCFMTPDCEPSMTTVFARLCAINYTSALAAYIDNLPGGGGDGDDDANIDGLPPKVREVVQFLKDKGLSTAAAIGIAGNIKEESDFNTACVGDHGTSFGICQWHFERGAAMKRHAGSNWAHNLTGQLEYLWIELNGSYKHVLQYLKGVPNTLDGAKAAADEFCRKFEIPKYLDKQSALRQVNAANYWKKISVSGGSSKSRGKIKMRSGKVVKTGKTVLIPKSVPQTGIIANYTSYTDFYPRWSRGTRQRQLADIWASKGKKHKYGIAKIDGYYLLGLTPKFGTTGDAVSIVLEDGTYFNAILGDIKGADAQGPWGHKLGGAYDIVEWEMYGNVQSTLRSGLRQAGWLGKKVAKIINYGSWLNG